MITFISNLKSFNFIPQENNTKISVTLNSNCPSDDRMRYFVARTRREAKDHSAGTLVKADAPIYAFPARILLTGELVELAILA